MRGILVDLTIRRTRFTITRERDDRQTSYQQYFIDGEQVTIREYLKRIAKEQADRDACGTDARLGANSDANRER